jgi:hypothetical protein
MAVTDESIGSILAPVEVVPEPPEITVLAAAKNDYSLFLKNNPASNIGEIETKTEPIIVIQKAWNDPSFVLKIPSDDASLREALNNIYLPERFTGIWHIDTKDLEIIWTAFPLDPLWREIPGRSFKFKFDAIEYVCEFTHSSDRLLAIAECVRPVTSSKTSFRNLESFRTHTVLVANRERDETLPEPHTSPLSFWIRNIEWNEDKVLALVNNLNFHLTYFDSISPYIVVHNTEEPAAIRPQPRYPSGAFPGNIDARPLDDVLLQLWMAAKKADEANRFLYCYRIIEYASFSYLDVQSRLEIRRILAAADALDNISSVTERVVEAMQKAKLEDNAKLQALLEDTVSPKFLWREIVENVTSLTNVTSFDGGFEIKALVPPGMTEDQFENNGVKTFADAIRKIRNALAHGKDLKTAGVILPTVMNLARLKPWTSLISVAAGEVILLKNIV